MPLKKEKQYQAGTGRYRVWGAAWETGQGVVFGLFGGDRPHVGTVVVGLPRPSLRDPRLPSCTSSVFNLVGHKEEELVRPLAEEATRRLRQPVVVVAGIHVDAATDQDLQLLIDNARRTFHHLLEAVVASEGNPESV